MEDLLRVSSLAVSYNGKRVLSDLTFSQKKNWRKNSFAMQRRFFRNV